MLILCCSIFCGSFGAFYFGKFKLHKYVRFEFAKIKGPKIFLHVKSPTVRASNLSGFTVCYKLKVCVQLEKIRSRAIQTALAGAGTKSPDKLITDDELIVLLKKCADERGDLTKKTQVSLSVCLYIFIVIIVIIHF